VFREPNDSLNPVLTLDHEFRYVRFVDQFDDDGGA
jgi:hypothetical protein